MKWLRKLFIGGHREIKRPKAPVDYTLEQRIREAERAIEPKADRTEQFYELHRQLKRAVRSGDVETGKRLTREIAKQ